MIIGIDGYEANVEKRVGIGQYAYQLLKEFRAQSSEFKAQSDSSKFKVYLKNYPPLSDMPDEDENWQYVKLPDLPFSTLTSLPLKLFLEKEKCDVFLSPTHYAPAFAPCPIVVSVMDLSYLYFPDSFRKRDLWQLKVMGGRSIKQAAKILTISESTRRDIVKEYKVKPEKIVVTYPGYNKIKFKVQSSKFKADKIRKKYGIRGDYVLYAGTLQPRKNLNRLIEVFRELQTADCELVITGKKGWLYEPIFNKVKELGLQSRVVFAGFVPDEDLSALMSGACLFVLPSLYEGFGIPALEAMAVGAPVAVSNASSLPEVIGEAGILFDPYDIKDMAEKIGRVIRDVKAREKMRKKGLERAKMFSWEECGRKTLETIKKAGNNNF